MNGRIRTLEGLMQAARRRRAVVTLMPAARMPAAFVIGMPARLVHSYIQRGMYLYKKGKKK